MATAINSNVYKSQQVSCEVELHGIHTRGQLCVDWQFKHFSGRKIDLITELNQDLYGDMLVTAIRK